MVDRHSTDPTISGKESKKISFPTEMEHPSSPSKYSCKSYSNNYHSDFFIFMGTVEEILQRLEKNYDPNIRKKILNLYLTGSRFLLPHPVEISLTNFHGIGSMERRVRTVIGT